MGDASLGVSSGEHWWAIGPEGRVFAIGRDSRPVDGERAAGWLDQRTQTGVVARLGGAKAAIERLPTEVVDILSARFPGIRWFVSSQSDEARAA